MVVENVEIVRYYMAKSNHFSTMVGEIFEILKYEMAKINHFFTMVGENFENIKAWSTILSGEDTLTSNVPLEA